LAGPGRQVRGAWRGKATRRPSDSAEVERALSWQSCYRRLQFGGIGLWTVLCDWLLACALACFNRLQAG
jgi:hypothetical protein